MGGRNRKKQKRGHKSGRDLESKVRESGGRTGFGLGAAPSEGDHDENTSTRSMLGITTSVTSQSRSRANASSSRRSARASGSAINRHSAHIVCAISENLAKETCVASLDARAPVHLQVTKQGNGQTYAETLAYLELLDPHEILLNEGRAGSTLVRKILELNPEDQEELNHAGGMDRNGPGSTKAVVKFISRACFDQTKGAELLSRVARDETYDASVVGEYILLSSAHAVLHYTQQHLGGSFARKSLDLLVNSGGTSKMVIDRSTLMQLEVLANAKTGKTKCSLIATIDYTKTTVGNRLLRTNLMAPPTRSDTITSRLDLVDAFLANEDFFYSVLEILQTLPCLDQMLTNVALVPQKRTNNKKKNSHDAGAALGGGTEVTKKIARKGISALVGIKTTLSALPAFVQVLEQRLEELDSASSSSIGAPARGGTSDNDASTLKSSLLLGLGGGPRELQLRENHLLRAIIIAMKNPALRAIHDSVAATFTNSTTSAHRSSHAMRHEECFALQAEKTSMMNVVRKAFLANVDDIYQIADDLSGKHGFYVSVRYSSSRGYFLAVPEGTNLPSEFIHPAKNGRFVTCTTEAVQGLNIRSQDNVQDLLYMTDAKIQEVLEFARSQYDALASLSDAIAILDMCHSFADCVTSKSTRPWCRPILTTTQDDEEEEEEEDDDGTPGNTNNNNINNNSALVIKNGRYIIEVSNCHTSNNGIQDFVANDTYATTAKPFTVITGINGSGKSTYLKQIAIIVILAQCGGYVPAEFATIPIRDRLCTRIGNTDDPEHNISTFMFEMKETSFICRNATPNSLLLLDELGRATSNEDGVALAWAVSERLLQSGALTFFVTHYPQVTLLGHKNMYASVQNQHMAATVGRQDGARGDISYTHKVSSGPCTADEAYGVDLAHACGWPDDVLGEAKNYESRMKESADETQLVTDHHPHQKANDSAISWRQQVASLIPQLKSLLPKKESFDVLALKQDIQKVTISIQQNSHVRAYVLDRRVPAAEMNGEAQRQLESAHGRHVMDNGRESPNGKHRSPPARTIDIASSESESDSESSSDSSSSSSTSEDSDS